VTIDGKIAALQTSFLTDEARLLGLIVPEFDTSENGRWEAASTAPWYYLKDEAIVELRSAVRKEKKSGVKCGSHGPHSRLGLLAR
jgi:hypothetical protein